MEWVILLVIVAVVAVVGLRAYRARSGSPRVYGDSYPEVGGPRQQKPPGQWVTGGQPSTPAQRATLARHGIDATFMTKAQASMEIEKWLGR